MPMRKRTPSAECGRKTFTPSKHLVSGAQMKVTGISKQFPNSVANSMLLNSGSLNNYAEIILVGPACDSVANLNSRTALAGHVCESAANLNSEIALAGQLCDLAVICDSENALAGHRSDSAVIGDDLCVDKNCDAKCVDSNPWVVVDMNPSTMVSLEEFPPLAPSYGKM